MPSSLAQYYVWGQRQAHAVFRGDFDFVQADYLKYPSFLRHTKRQDGTMQTSAVVLSVCCMFLDALDTVSPDHLCALCVLQIVKFDSFVKELRYGGLYSDVTFQLRGGDGTPSTWKGGYLICDGGYNLACSCVVLVCM